MSGVANARPAFLYTCTSADDGDARCTGTVSEKNTAELKVTILYYITYALVV